MICLVKKKKIQKINVSKSQAAYTTIGCHCQKSTAFQLDVLRG